jgi:hypothetical protein
MGACRPTNDTPATAVVLPFELGNSRSVSATTANATNDAGACMGSTGTIYYRIDLTQRSIVYVDTFGTMTNGDVRKAVHHCADDQIYPWKLQGILS